MQLIYQNIYGLEKSEKIKKKKNSQFCSFE